MLQSKIKDTNRINLEKETQDLIEIPNLIEMQVEAYRRFLQTDVPMDQRKPMLGLESVFRNTFPIESPNKDIILEYHGYSFGDIKYSEEESRKRDLTYSIVLKATIRLIYRDTGEVREKEVYMGDIPLMTTRGTFIINGAERVVVSQIHKSPGIAFSEGDNVYSAKIIPDKGAWLEFELDLNKELLNIKIDRKKGILITTFLRAIAFDTNAEILSRFYNIEEVDLSLDKGKELIENSPHQLRCAEDIIEPNTNEVIFYAAAELVSQDAEKILSFGINKIKILSPEDILENPIIIKCLDSDDVSNKEEAISKLHAFMRPGEPATIENAIKEFNALFFDPKRYNLGIVGRYKFNQKLYSADDKPTEELILTVEDIVAAIKYLIQIYNSKETTDDIDHLGNRRIRCVDELLVNQLRVGFARMERAIKERISTEDFDEITPQKLLSIKPISAVIKEFFTSSQLSQFMDQTNPLAELTHKRRINALGPGGLSRERAGFEVRDVHYTHYGKICPIETPEGPNIGLILSLCNYSKINEYGFLVTPYIKVQDGKVTDEVDYLTATEEDRYYIAPANVPRDDKGNIVGELVDARYRGEYPLANPSQIKYIDVSPKQIISVSTALIPFLEHDDANRALMGSNMQRQAVPLLNAESPVVGTGMEAKAAYDSGTCVIAKRSGEIIKASSEEIHIKVKDDNENPVDIYSLAKYQRTNQNTCFNQKPIVSKNDNINEGELIADGPAISNKELALGRNVLVAFMSWKGQNFEDAIIISDRMVKANIFTSIHIEEFEIEVRETKLGSEKITKDIPNLNEDSFTNLDEDGVVRVGAWVKGGDILVGKITPKGETESTPEYKLLHSIFGEKAREVKDTSLRVPHGNGGVVIGVSVFKRETEDKLPPGVEEMVKVYIAKKRKIAEGDKMAGRHGNKGVISKIVPEEDMPFLPDGTPIDIILNPLGVPSRMNLGQILEAQLGQAAHKLGVKFAVPVFSGITLKEINAKLTEAELPEYGKTKLTDGLTGEPFENEVTVGYIYMLKLAHMVDDKLHARSTGPYSLVTQQPLGGKAQFGGQRLGEMEVWALEAYGAAHTLQEFLTVKADDMMGRAKIYENIVKGEIAYKPGVPESFNVLVQELRGLGLDLNIYDKDNNIVGLTDKDIENLNKMKNKI